MNRLLERLLCLLGKHGHMTLTHTPWSRTDPFFGTEQGCHYRLAWVRCDRCGGRVDREIEYCPHKTGVRWPS